jgi:type II secretory pathway pseudopilin PulG
VTKRTTTLAGVAAVIAIIVATVLLGVLPQIRAASEAKAAEAELAQTNAILATQLGSLDQQSNAIGDLEHEIELLRSQIPGTPDLAGVTRVIVSALTAPDGSTSATLSSITPQVPAVAFIPHEQLSRTVGEPEVPAPPVVAEEAPAATAFQEIPLNITATAPDMEAAFRFVDLLNDGPRLLAVHHVQLVRTEGRVEGAAPEVTIAVVGAAYVQPSATGGEG